MNPINYQHLANQIHLSFGYNSIAVETKLTGSANLLLCADIWAEKHDVQVINLTTIIEINRQESIISPNFDKGKFIRKLKTKLPRCKQSN